MVIFVYFHIFLQYDLGLIIDLTNTDRFYKKSVVEDEGIKYCKVQCRGYALFLKIHLMSFNSGFMCIFHLRCLWICHNLYYQAIFFLLNVYFI